MKNMTIAYTTLIVITLVQLALCLEFKKHPPVNDGTGTTIVYDGERVEN